MDYKGQLIEKIKQKKELSTLSDSIVIEVLENYLKKNRISLEIKAEKQLKVIVKEVRAQLRLYTGRFQKSAKKRQILLKQNKIQELLRTHSSTEERIHFYQKLKRIIRSLNVKSVLDLGCGINPIALADKNTIYYAADINQSDLDLINIYFKKNKIKGKIFYYNLKNIKPDLPKADLCLLLKVLDVLEEKGHKIAEKIIKNISCKYFLVSFPTKTLSKAPMKHPQRGWIERLLTRLEYKFNLIKSKNEIFYLVEKTSSIIN
jgi:hypothetical protein